MVFIETRTYDEIEVGDSATLTRALKPEDVQLFAVMSGEVNPAHVDPWIRSTPRAACSAK